MRRILLSVAIAAALLPTTGFSEDQGSLDMICNTPLGHDACESGRHTDPIDDGQGVEFFYDVAMTEAFRLAFDFQVDDPTSARADTAVMPGIRGRIEF